MTQSNVASVTVVTDYSPMPDQQPGTNLGVQGPGVQELSRERAELTLAHLGLADALARRYCNGYADWSDMQQVARLGLVMAALRFRTGGGSSFIAYAVPTICGELKRHLRDHGWLVRPPRRIQELRQRLRPAVAEMTQQLGREPTSAELAGALKVGTKDVDEALLSEAGMHSLSLDADAFSDERTGLSEHLGYCDEALARIDEVVSLEVILQGLTVQERRLLSLRFCEDLAQQDMAAILNISQMQLSRALATLLAKMRRALDEN